SNFLALRAISRSSRSSPMYRLPMPFGCPGIFGLFIGKLLIAARVSIVAGVLARVVALRYGGPTLVLQNKGSANEAATETGAGRRPSRRRARSKTCDSIAAPSPSYPGSTCGCSKEKWATIAERGNPDQA